MIKKIIIVGITFVFLILAGVFYSCSFNYNKNTSAIVTTMEGTNNEELKLQLNGDVNNSKNSSSEGKSKENSEENALENVANNAIDNTKEELIEGLYIHICGAVNLPDVYKVEEGTRLFNVVRLAGGLREDAADAYINLAQVVMDGQRIYIPTKEEVKDKNPEDFQTLNNTINIQSGANNLVNINSANMDELMKLPGIGQAKAQSIIEYRNTKGKFSTIEELMNVAGIKEGLFQKISSAITVK